MAKAHKILLVEDEALLRQNVKNQLISAGYQVTDVENGALAKDLLQEKHFHLIISDLKMPVMNGLKLVMFVKSELTTPMILMTAHEDLGAAGTVRGSGVDAIITKPFSKSDLLAEIDNLLSK